MMKQDSALERVREARRAISAACDHDPKKLVAYYQERARRRQEQKRPQDPQEERRHEAA